MKPSLAVLIVLVFSACSGTKTSHPFGSDAAASIKQKIIRPLNFNGFSKSETVKQTEEKSLIKLPPSDNPSGIAIVDDKPEQHFKLNCTRDTTITCAEGTKIFVPAKAFVDDKNKTVTSVEFGVREYYKDGDIILAGLTTHAQKKMLETGGMVYLTASTNESECTLAKGKNLDLSFPTKKFKNGMQLFNGQRKGNTIDWVAAPLPPQPIFVPPVITDEVIDDEVYEDAPMVVAMDEVYNVVEEKEKDVFDSYEVQEQPVFQDASGTLMSYLEKNVKYPQMCIDANIQGKVYIQFTVDENGTVIDPIIKRGIHPALDGEAKRVVTSMPKWKSAKANNKSVKCRMVLPINFKLSDGGGGTVVDNNVSINNTQQPSREENVKQYVETIEDIHEVEREQLEYYMMSSAKLGWINCDRFVGQPTNERLAVNETDKASTTVRMVFKNINSVMGARFENSQYVFDRLPSNQPVILVGFKKVGNKNFIATQETTTSAVKVVNLNYKEVSLEELKETVKKLNTGTVI